ncbi:MmcQ/YjbR family DNA-binding protein, partial [Oleiphilus sp. HI0079]|uniref:MmcQ/YjbR family DNA-binding protein n=1 Tax=Oleiphilus sp. HI0079 TaxID=1822254 RepID=UPI000A4AB716
KNLPATKLVRQWGDAYVWKVGDKVFAIGGWQKSAAPAFTFKTGDLDYHILKEEPGFRPAPYMAARGMKWIQFMMRHVNETMSCFIIFKHRTA